MFKTGFANIRTQRYGDRVQGYQAIVGDSCSRQVKASLGQTALREVLELRNAIYREQGTVHYLLHRRHATGGINDTFDNNGDGARIPCFNVQLRNLQTGKPAQRRFRHDQHPSKKTARKAAKALETSNVEAYNAMVDLYNDMVFQDGLKIAEREVKTLKPQLDRLKVTARERWALVYAEFFPNGLASPVDPGSRVKER